MTDSVQGSAAWPADVSIGGQCPVHYQPLGACCSPAVRYVPPERGFAGIAPAVPTARLRALVALLYPEEMTPMAKRQIENVIEEYEPDE